MDCRERERDYIREHKERVKQAMRLMKPPTCKSKIGFFERQAEKDSDERDRDRKRKKRMGQKEK